MISGAPVVILDTETTGLSLDDDIWEFAAIRLDRDGREQERVAFQIEHSLSKASKLPEAFREQHDRRYDSALALSRTVAADEIYRVLQRELDGTRVHVVGAVPNFDTERISRFLAWAGYTNVEPWHYHLIDVENLAVGWLFGHGKAAEEYSNFDPDDGIALPWASHAISDALGIRGDWEEHTAMGDVEWAYAIFKRVMRLPNND
jgi:hypothetical protein